MDFDTHVLIVGAGPTGLMMACQLQRFGIPFRIIDQQADRAHESRAFAIQARSMEIFQNLGIVDEFLQRAQRGVEVNFYINGKEKLKWQFKNINIEGAPYPSIFFLPQSETEEILLQHLQKLGIVVERQTKLISFSQTNKNIAAKIYNQHGEIENIHCRYIAGCDGAHSTVRHILNIPFEGAAYPQEFILADAEVQWPFSTDSRFKAFFDKHGLFLHVPLGERISRIMGARIRNTKKKNEEPLTQEEVERIARQITHMNIRISNVAWLSRFYLHHRAVSHYQKGNAFLVGDAAHIHSPVGGQGMNTGLQDASNLAWKLAFSIKYSSPDALLETYNKERHYIGEILVHSTDRIFSLMTSSNFIIAALRRIWMPTAMYFIAKFPAIQKYLFRFISQLGIHYPKNEFIDEKKEGADSRFLSGPKAGCRAPDAPLQESSLFELLRKNFCCVLIFQDSEEQAKKQETQILQLEKSFSMINFYRVKESSATRIIFQRYSVTTAAIYFIRPDGYIGFRSAGIDLNRLAEYLKKLI